MAVNQVNGSQTAKKDFQYLAGSTKIGDKIVVIPLSLKETQRWSKVYISFAAKDNAGANAPITTTTQENGTADLFLVGLKDEPTGILSGDAVLHLDLEETSFTKSDKTTAEPFTLTSICSLTTVAKGGTDGLEVGMFPTNVVATGLKSANFSTNTFLLKGRWIEIEGQSNTNEHLAIVIVYTVATDADTTGTLRIRSLGTR